MKLHIIRIMMIPIGKALIIETLWMLFIELAENTKAIGSTISRMHHSRDVYKRQGYDAADIMSCLNRYLPADIAVTDICEVPERFHSRLNAVRKTYRYRIHAGAVKNVFGRNYIYSIEEMPDAELMRQAAAHLVGEHDFKSFCSNRHMKKSTVRHLYEITINQYGPELSMEFSGNGFLYNMVRILAGTLLEAGLGHIAPDRMTCLLYTSCIIWLIFLPSAGRKPPGSVDFLTTLYGLDVKCQLIWACGPVLSRLFNIYFISSIRFSITFP